MSTISAGTTNSTALVETGDTTGNLIIKANTSTTVGTFSSTGLAVVGSLTSTVAAAGAFTTLSATGTITSTKSGYVLQRTGVDTGYQAINLGNTGADCYLGAERSTGSGILNGSTGYALVINNASNVPVQIGSNNVVVATFKQGGSLALENATTSTGCGITFPATQSASTNANTLDDYEEGTWTPTLAFGGGSTGIVYGGRVGNYIKVGSLVTAQCAVDITNRGSSTGSASISGFPFTVSGTFITIIGSQLVSWTGAGPCQLLFNSGTTANFYGIPNGVGLGWTALLNTDFGNTAQFYFTMVYKV